MYFNCSYFGEIVFGLVWVSVWEIVCCVGGDLAAAAYIYREVEILEFLSLFRFVLD